MYGPGDSQRLLDDILAYNAACGTHDLLKEKQMKTCHACGQKLPLKAGEMVEFKDVMFPSRTYRGITLCVAGTTVKVMALDTGLTYFREPSKITRLHGYYRITEREPLA